MSLPTPKIKAPLMMLHIYTNVISVWDVLNGSLSPIMVLLDLHNTNTQTNTHTS